MTRLLIVLTALLFLVSLPCMALVRRDGTLYFLNAPERVTRPGTLAALTLPGRKKARIFFHYVNCTHQGQRFEVLSSSAILHARCASNYDYDPGHAGSTTGAHFFSQQPHTCYPPVLIRCQLAPGMVVSGILDGYPARQTMLSCRMGSGASVPSGRVLTTQVAKDIQMALSGYRQSASVRVGESHKGDVDGEYGRSVRVHAKVDHPCRLRVTVSPRGGHIRFVYRHNGSVHEMVGCMAMHWYELFSIPIKDRDTIEIIPSGGYCYPVLLSYQLLNLPHAVATQKVKRKR